MRHFLHASSYDFFIHIVEKCVYVVEIVYSFFDEIFYDYISFYAMR